MDIQKEGEFLGFIFSKSPAIYGENKRLSRRAKNINEKICCKQLINMCLHVFKGLKKNV
jgi:hypothetical protein